MLSSRKTILDIPNEILSKRLIMRVDYNVPIKNGVVTDKTRIIATIPTINYALEKGASGIILISHCGRPDGQKIEKYSLSPVQSILSDLLKKKIDFFEDCVGDEVEKKCANLKNGEIILLENLRFHPEEEGSGKLSDGTKVKSSQEDIDKFRNSLTKLGDIFINDAFGTAHRAHSSVVGINLSIRAAGLLMKKELDYFSKALETSKTPFLAILGGAKVSDKIQLIYNLLEKVNVMIIGGGMAFTFIKVLHKISIGKSLFDEKGANLVEKIMEEAGKKNVEILLPTDFVCGNKFSNDAKIELCSIENGGIPDGFIGMDCGEKSIEEAKKRILSAKTILWNGPQGVFEFEKFSNGSLKFLDFVVESTENGCISIIGGGDTASLVTNAGKADKVSHVSTGGGASLELVEGKILPGVEALSPK